jgi:D-sedoheptulose 7-phosphate isomerase
MDSNIFNYFEGLYQLLQTISTTQLQAATAILDAAYRYDRTVYVIGNGQSASTASAFALDLTKQSAPPPPKKRFRTLSLTDNVSALTAWGNDLNYESVFTEQLRALMSPGDILMGISVSGSSPNVIHASKWARENGAKVIGLAGFNGGELLDNTDACLVFNSRDYGYVETAHIAVLHYWVDLFRERLAQ